MQLYWIPTENRYVRTQGEAKKLGFGEVTEVPVDKDGLMAFLNALQKPVQSVEDKPCPECPECPKCPEAPAEPKIAQDFSADAVLSRMDNPGGEVDKAVELIARSKGYALKRFAGAVAQAFQNLEKMK